MSNARRMLTVRVSDDARHAIAAYCLANGITITAWIEAVGQRLIELAADEQAETALRSEVERTVQIARRIDAERRARTPER